MNKDEIIASYEFAKKAYAALGVDTDSAIKAALAAPISVHCWQGDDVAGFEGETLAGGGILATGNYPGRARNGGELRSDIEAAFALIPGKKRLNLHAFYAEIEGAKSVSRDALLPEHFAAWMAWSRDKKVPLDFNSSCFSHPEASTGWTLSSADKKTRDFWVRHAKAARAIAEAMGQNQDSPCVINHWIPDGSKDYPASRLAPRERLRDALDDILAQKYPHIVDTLESKLFGIGSEAYVTGSHEFYMGYAVSRQVYLCLDAGHFHPTETIADKISAMLLFAPGLLVHFSRGLRWDSDHVASFSDDLRDTCREIVRSRAASRVLLALDFFDASINRIAAWVIGSRSLRKGMLEAHLEPTQLLLDAEKAGKFHERLALLEEFKTLPFGAVWDKLCLEAGVPVGRAWLSEVDRYEERIFRQR